VVAASKNPSPKAILHGFLSVTVKVSELLQDKKLVDSVFANAL